MASYKNIQKSRTKKDSHFSYSSERMTSLTAPPPPPLATVEGRTQEPSSILSVTPHQVPLERKSHASSSSSSSQLQIPTEALSKLQEIIEAQKGFMKYQEMREILQSRQSNRTERRSEVKPSVSPTDRSDSDKENMKRGGTGSVESVKKGQEVAKAEENIKRVKEATGSVESMKGGEVAVSEETPRVPPLRLGGVEGEEVACDWAYWYQPDTRSIKPARVTIKSRPAPVGGARARSRSRDERGGREEREERAGVEERPWRAGMKRTEKEVVVVTKEKIPEKAEPVKPWRTNMRREPRAVKPVETVKPKTEERAWRNNMKRSKAETQTEPGPVRRRHYDKGEVRQFMRERKLREKEESEERERQKHLSKEMIKRRLQELDKLQKQIAEADVREFKRLSKSERNLTEAGQEALREKLMELTEQMKSRWRERDRPVEERRSAEENVSSAVPSMFLFSDKEVSKQSLDLQEPASVHHESSATSSLSDVSDATEIKSLSENPRNISSRTDESSKLWKDRLSGKDLEETVYRQLERPSNVPTPLTDEVPVRENSRSEMVQKIVKDVLDRHKTDIDFIRNNMKDVDTVSGPLQPGEVFSPKYPTLLTTPPSLPDLETRPKPVPSALHQELSDGSRESEEPPHWIDVTKDNIDLQNEANNLSATVYKRLPQPEEEEEAGIERRNEDRNTFMKTIVRKYEMEAPNNTSIPSDMAISEGVLSDMSLSSPQPPSIPPPPVDTKTYSKDDPEVLGPVEIKAPETCSEEVTAETDSENTLRGIDDLILHNSPRLQLDLMKIRNAVEKRKRKKLKEKKEQKTGASSSAVPDALHLRFLTELHQLETVNNTQRLLDELEQIKKSSFENHRGLEEVQVEMNNQRKLIEDQNNAQQLRSAQKELEDLYSSKLQMLLENQNEVTKVTSEVARHLADIAGGKTEQNFSVVTELQRMIETLQSKQQQVSSTQTSQPAPRSKSSGREASTSYSRQASDRDETDGVVPTDIDSKTFSSKPPSSILELIEQNQAAGNSIQKTISEALASISESEKRTKSKSSNITEEVEEELSTDYSSHFEDESTLREISFHAVLPSVSHQKSLMSSEASDSSDREKDLSLFSDSQSFSRLTVELVRQHMQEQSIRDQHKAAILRARERDLIEKAKKKMEELDKLVGIDKGKDEKMPDIKKKKKAVLAKLKNRRAEIAQMRENLKQAEKDRKFLLKEQKVWMKAGAEESADQESEKISRIEVLQGLKKLDKSRRFQTSKERRLSDRIDQERTRSRLTSAPESENESLRDSTLSEHSDVEARISALSEKLQTRMRTAARLKKEQKKKSREKLRTQEVTLIKQIEKYEQLISEGLAEASDISSESFSKPKIKSPVSSSKFERRTPSPRKNTPEMPSISSVSLVEEEIRDRDSETVESPDVSTSTILASPSRAKTPSPQKLISEHISEILEDRSSPAVSSKSSSPVSKVKLIAEGKVPEILPQTPEKTRSSVGNHVASTDYSSEFDSDKSVLDKKEVAGRTVTDKLVDSITENIWQQIIQETKTTFSKPSKQEESPVRTSPDKTRLSKPKPRQTLRSQELTLAFDVGSSSEDSSPALVAEDERSEAEEQGEGAELQEFLDDDFGLSNIRKEEEILRLEQLRVEEEILILQRESSLLSSVPDKPPPPYQPPPDTPPPPRPAPPKPTKVLLPQQKAEILLILEDFVRIIYEAKHKGLDLRTLSCPPDLVTVPDSFNETEADTLRKYHGMLFSVTLEKVLEIFKFETLVQNPPWMEQLPLARMKFSAPQTLPDLVVRVQREVCSDLKLMKRVGRENLLVSWAGKKRDRVDEILVRELQEEEVLWTNYNEDEGMVKDQMTDILVESLITDTARVFENIYRGIKNS